MGMMMHRWKLRHAQEQKKMSEDTWKEGTSLVETSHEEPKEEKDENEGVVYTRDEINALPFFSLKSVASKYGIDVKGKKGNELKEELIEKLGI